MKLTVEELVQFSFDAKAVQNYIAEALNVKPPIGHLATAIEADRASRRIRRLASRLLKTEVRVP